MVNHVLVEPEPCHRQYVPARSVWPGVLGSLSLRPIQARPFSSPAHPFLITEDAVTTSSTVARLEELPSARHAAAAASQVYEPARVA